MATIATAEVQVIADTSRFVPDLRRKLKSAFASLGNELGNDIIKQFESRINKRLDTVMQRAGKNAANEFSKAFDTSLKNAGLSDSLREQLSNAGARRDAERAGESLAEATSKGFRGSNRLFTDAMLDALSTQTVIATAGFAGQDTAQSFTDNFRQGIRDEISNRINTALRDAAEEADNQVPALFRPTGIAISESVARGIRSRFRDINQALLFGLASNPDLDSTAFFAGQRAGIQFSDGLFEPLGDRFQRQMRETLEEAEDNVIPPAFRNMGQTAATSFTDEFEDEVDLTFGGRLRRIFSGFGNQLQNLTGRLGDLPDALRRIGPAATIASRALQGLGGALLNLIQLTTVTPLLNLANLFSELSTEMASAAAIGLLLLGVLDQLSGLLFAVPAAFGLLSAAVATVLVSFNGMIEAFDKGGEALEGLAPAAQSVAREFLALKDDFRLLKLDAQEALWSELDGAITAVADNLLGPVREGMTLASGALGRLIRGVTDFLAETETAETTVAIFESLAAIFDSLSDEIQPFLRGLRTLTNEFLPGLEDIEDTINGIGSAFEDWVTEMTTGDLLSGISPAQRAFETALATLEQLSDIIGNIFNAVQSVFDAANDNAFGFLDLMERITEEIADAFASPEGQETLSDFLGDMVQISDVVLGLIGTILSQLPKLADPLSDIAQDIGPDLEEFINNIGDGFNALLDSGGDQFLRDLAGALSDIDWEDLGTTIGELLADIGPVLDEVAGLINNLFTVADVLGEIIGFLIDFIDFLSQIGASEGDLADFIDEFGQFSEIIPNLQKFFTETAQGWADLFRDIADSNFVETIVGWLSDDSISQGLSDFFSFIGDELAEGLQGVGEFFTETASGWGQLLSDAAASVGEFFTETLPNWAIEGTGSVLQIVFNWISELTDALRELWEGLTSGAGDFFVGLGEEFTTGLDSAQLIVAGWITGVQTTLDTMWVNLGDRARLALDALNLDIGGSLDTASSNFSEKTSDISEDWRRFWDNVKTTVQNALNAVRTTISNILSSIRSTIIGWIDGIRSRWNSFWSGLKNAVSGGLSSARSSVISGLNLIRDAFSSFSDRVRSILSSLRDFISGIFSRIQGIVSNIAGAVSSAISAAQSLGNIDINPFADGGIVSSPTVGLVGEAGREVIIPLTRPQRAVELVQQSGLLGLLASQGVLAGAGTDGGRPIEINVNSQTADPEQVARRAMRLLQRQLGGRGLERTR